MTMQQAQLAVTELVRDSDAVNQAIKTLLQNARRNGLKTSVVLGFLVHKFQCVESGLAEIVLDQMENSQVDPTLN